MVFDGLDEVERAKLEELVDGLQRFIGAGDVGSSSTSMLVGATLGNAEKRIEVLGGHLTTGASEKERKEEKHFQNLVVGYLVQREVNLNAGERAQFGSFLEKPFFTRGDFDELNQFYGSAYVHLSERGQAELSFRIFEGIRQGEYQFTDLPENPKRKEAEWIYELMIDPARMPKSYNNIPDEKRASFEKAMESGNRGAAYEVLNDPEVYQEISTSPQIEKADRPSNVTRESEQLTEMKSGNSRESEQSSIPPSDLMASLEGELANNEGRAI